MAKPSPRAECLVCNSRISDRGMARHLKTCLTKNQEKRLRQPGCVAGTVLHIRVRDLYATAYWMHLGVNIWATFGDLDIFLRRIWLECCGHLSAFSFKRKDIDMDAAVMRSVVAGMELLHEYDFGSTTSLLVKVQDRHQAAVLKDEPIELFARNEPPEIWCDECGNQLAVVICPDCQWDECGWLCKSCSKKHQCGDELFLPVVNSPRAGVCAYTGRP